MKEFKDYLAYQGEQYRNPDKAGAEKDKMLDLRQKGQEARKAFTHLAECFHGAPINAGYMVLNPEIFDYIEGDDTVFEKEPLDASGAGNSMSRRTIPALSAEQ